MGTAVAALIAAGGAAAAAAALYLLGLTVAAAAYRRRHVTGRPALRLAVVVPAHDESGNIATCVASLAGQWYPRELFRVVVIADNCQDDTARVAAAAGAEVLVRADADAQGKGHALRWAIGRLMAAHDPPDAFVFVDADSIAEPSLLAALEARVRCGAGAAQADYAVLHPEDDPLRAAALGLFNHVRSQGRELLGLPAQLLGNGMIVSRDVLQRLPWTALSPVEDLEYTLRLRLARVHTVFTSQAGVLGPLPPTAAAATTQRLRWEGGRLFVLRRHWRELAGAVPTREGVAAAELLFSLLVPPIAALALLIFTGLAVSVAAATGGVTPWWTVLPWAVSAAAVAGHVLGGFHLVRAPRSAYVALLLRGPRFVAWKLGVYARLAGGGFNANRWERTARVAEVETAGR